MPATVKDRGDSMSMHSETMSMHAAAQPTGKWAKGRVRRIAPFTEVTYIRLYISEGGPSPQDGYFALRPDVHRNYNAMYSLALVAATNKRELLIRTSNNLTDQEPGEVQYMLVDFPED